MSQVIAAGKVYLDQSIASADQFILALELVTPEPWEREYVNQFKALAQERRLDAIATRMKIALVEKMMSKNKP